MLISILALMWNIAGVAYFLAHISMTQETLVQLGPEEHALYANTPGWATGAFAIAVFAGAIGALLMVRKNSVSTIFFQLSLAGVLVQMFHAFFMARIVHVLGVSSALMPLLVIAISAYLVLISYKARGHGWTV